MSDPQDQIRQAAREVGQELSRALEQAARMARAAGEDLSRLVGDPPRGFRPRRPPHESPAEAIRQLGRLRDEGLISEEEFQAKKAELLARI
jgi:hypothetical protein